MWSSKVSAWGPKFMTTDSKASASLSKDADAVISVVLDSGPQADAVEDNTLFLRDFSECQLPHQNAMKVLSLESVTRHT